MKTFLLSLVLLFTPLANAETIIIPVQDLLLEVPNFEAPKHGFNAALNGQYTVTQINKSKRDRNIEKKMINLAWDVYPDATNIRIWRGNFIITK